MKTKFSIIFGIEVTLPIVILIYLIYSVFCYRDLKHPQVRDVQIKLALFSIIIIILLGAVLYYASCLKRIETTSKEFHVTYFVLPFIKHWYRFDDFDGFFVVKTERRKSQKTELFLVKDHKVKLSILLDVYKNMDEVRKEFDQKMKCLGHKETSDFGSIIYHLGKRIDY